MENPLLQIKDAVIKVLKGIDSEMDVFFEEIKRMEDELKQVETYYFIDLIPTVSVTVDKYYTDMGVLVDIAYHEKSESNTAYLMKAAVLDAAFRPVLHFGGRNITISDANIKIVDHVLHYSFPVNFRCSRELPSEAGEMEELVVAVRKGV